MADVSWRAKVGFFTGKHNKLRGGFIIFDMNKVEMGTDDFIDTKKMTCFIIYGLIVSMLLVSSGVERNPGPSTEDLKTIIDAIQHAAAAQQQAAVAQQRATVAQTLELKGEMSGMKEMFTQYKMECDKRFNGMANDIDVLKEENTRLRDILDDTESYARKNNIIIFDVKEENDDSAAVVIRGICESLNVHVGPDGIVEAYRIGKNKGKRPLICKFTSFDKKMQVIHTNNALGDNRYNISHDLTKKQKADNKMYKPYKIDFIRNRQKAFVTKGKLFVDGLPWTMEQLIEKFGERSSNTGSGSEGGNNKNNANIAPQRPPSPSATPRRGGGGERQQAVAAVQPPAAAETTLAPRRQSSQTFFPPKSAATMRPPVNSYTEAAGKSPQRRSETMSVPTPSTASQSRLTLPQSVTSQTPMETAGIPSPSPATNKKTAPAPGQNDKGGEKLSNTMRKSPNQITGNVSPPPQPDKRQKLSRAL